jgi:hypothetical protein
VNPPVFKYTIFVQMLKDRTRGRHYKCLPNMCRPRLRNYRAGRRGAKL